MSNVVLQELVRLTDGVRHFNQVHLPDTYSNRVFDGLLNSERFDAAAKQAIAAKLDPTAQCEALFFQNHRIIALLGIELVQNPYIAMLKEIEAPDAIESESITQSVVIEIQDPGKLTSFLKSLSRDDVLLPEIQYSLQFLSETFASGIIKEYERARLVDDNQQLHQFLDVIGEVNSEFLRLGLGITARTLRYYFEHALNGDLTEFIIAEESFIINSETSGPHNWHFNPNPQLFTELWTTAVGALEFVRENPQAKEIAGDAAEYLRASHAQAEAFLEDPSNLNDEVDANGYPFREMREVLEEVREYLW